MLRIVEDNGAKNDNLELVPAIMYSTDDFAVFFYADPDTADKLGQCAQGPPGRVNLTPICYTSPNGREVVLPNLSVEPAGRVAFSPPKHERHEIYHGYDGLARFFSVHPIFNIYRPYLQNILGTEIKQFSGNIEEKISA